MKKYDIYLAGAIVLIALVWILLNRFIKESGSKLLVYSNNALTGEYALKENGNFSVNDDNGKEILKFTIDNGLVDVTFAECKDKLCVHQLPISKAGETIVCLPQKIVLKIDAASNNHGDLPDFDAVVY